MTLTTASTVRRPALHLSRQSVVAFVAGVALAGAIAVGVDVAHTDVAAPKPVTRVLVVPSASPATHCPVLPGRC